MLTPENLQLSNSQKMLQFSYIHFLKQGPTKAAFPSLKLMKLFLLVKPHHQKACTSPKRKTKLCQKKVINIIQDKHHYDNRWDKLRICWAVYSPWYHWLLCPHSILPTKVVLRIMYDKLIHTLKYFKHYRLRDAWEGFSSKVRELGSVLQSQTNSRYDQI